MLTVSDDAERRVDAMDAVVGVDAVEVVGAIVEGVANEGVTGGVDCGLVTCYSFITCYSLIIRNSLVTSGCSLNTCYSFITCYSLIIRNSLVTIG